MTTSPTESIKLRPIAVAAQHTNNNAVILGVTDQGERYIANALLPCGLCQPCQAALHLACSNPFSVSAAAAAGLKGDFLTVPVSYLAPNIPEHLDVDAAVRLLAIAGPTYQAIATAGITPGDVVILCGNAPALTEHMLTAIGMRTIRLTTDHLKLSDLPSVRFHLFGYTLTDDLLALMSPLFQGAISITFIGSLPCTIAQLALERLFAGSAAVRRIENMHPHLTFDLLGLLSQGRINNQDLTELS